MKDLSGDGKITKKDVLIGRGVLPKNAKNGGLTAGIKNIKGLKDGTKGSDKIIVKDGKSEKQLLKEAGERGRNRAKRFVDTINTINEKDMVRDSKTGKEMSLKQFDNLRKKQRIESNRGLKNGGQVKARGQGAATRGFNFKVN